MLNNRPVSKIVVNTHGAIREITDVQIAPSVMRLEFEDGNGFVVTYTARRPVRAIPLEAITLIEFGDPVEPKKGA